MTHINLESKEHVLTEATTGMTIDTVIYIFSLCITGILLFLLVYFVITLSDLECDYLNAQQCCSRLNMWIIPKIVSHGILSSIFCFSGHYYLFLGSLPLLIYMTYEYKKVPSGDFGVYDPTEILKHGHVKAHMRDIVIGIFNYLISFFIYLFCLLTHLLKSTYITKPTYNDDLGL